MKKLVYALGLLLFIACSNGEKKANSEPTEYITETKVDYYPDGRLKLEGQTVNGKAHGLWKYYYPNGILWSEGMFRHGVREGISRIYRKSGKKWMQGKYEKGKREGWWLVWKENGSLADSIDLSQPLTANDSLLLEIQ